MSYQAIKDLVGYALRTGLIEEYDRPWAVNELLKASTKKTVAEVAKEVVSGKWGNGADRKKKLEAAGYNYAEVQKEVNKLLK